MSTGPNPQHDSIITNDGERRILNLQPSPADSTRKYAAIPPLTLPIGEIKDFLDWPAGVKIKNQGNIGACNAFASSTACEFTREMNGLDYETLSPWWIYGNLVHGWDRGSNISQALDLIMKSGVAPDTDVPQRDYSGKYTDTAKTNALKYRLEIGSMLTTWEQILTAIALRKGVNLSVRATAGWSGRLDANGCPPVGIGPHNHAVMTGGGIKTLPGGKRAILMANSWGTAWGDAGFCWLTEDHCFRGSWRESFVAGAVVVEPGHPSA